MSLELFFRPKLRRLRIVNLTCYILLIAGLSLRYHVYQPYLRGILVASCHAPALRQAEILLQVLPEVLNVLALLAVFITFYAWFGCVMFVGTPEGRTHFPSLVEAWWTLWICVTTANYPDVYVDVMSQCDVVQVATWYELTSSVFFQYDAVVQHEPMDRSLLCLVYGIILLLFDECDFVFSCG